MKDITKHPEYFNLDFRFPNEVFKKVSKEIPKYESYKISNYGRIISYAKKKTTILKQSNSLGYKIVNLGWKNPIRISRLTAITFIPNLKNNQEINHKNGIKYDNHVENLEWCTHQENMIHAVMTRLRNYDNVRRSKKFTCTEIKEILQLKKLNIPIRLIAKKYKRHQNTVYRLIWRHINNMKKPMSKTAFSKN